MEFKKSYIIKNRLVSMRYFKTKFKVVCVGGSARWVIRIKHRGLDYEYDGISVRDINPFGSNSINKNKTYLRVVEGYINNAVNLNELGW